MFIELHTNDGRVSPSKMVELFSLKKRRNEEGNPIEWEKHKSVPIIPDTETKPPYSYTLRESAVIRKILNIISDKGLELVE